MVINDYLQLGVMDPETQASQEQTATPEAAIDNAEDTAVAPPDPDAPAFGWTRYAERINGRFAMVGFIALLILEFFTRQDFFTWLGF